MTVPAQDLDELRLSLLAKAAQFERVFGVRSFCAGLLRRAAESLRKLEQERADLASALNAACLARDAAGILATPADAIVMLDEDNRRLLAEIDALKRNQEGPAL